MRYLFVLRGAPGAGKSAFIKQNKLEPYTVSSDAFRCAVRAPIENISGKTMIAGKDDNVVFKQFFYPALENRMKHGDTTIVDTTCSQKKFLQKLRKLCKTYYYHIIVVDFETSLEKCKTNNVSREEYKIVSDNEIERVYNTISTWSIPSSVRCVSPDEMLEMITNIYKPLDLSNYKKIHHIGDIHGCYTVLNEYLKGSIDTNDEAYVFIGDYFDRGLQNALVFKYLNAIKDLPNVYLLIGNHELHLFAYTRGELSTGKRMYKQTIPELHEAGITDKQIRSFCKSLIPAMVYNYHDKKVIVSHAGVPCDSVKWCNSEELFTIGTGKYEDIYNICDDFNKKYSNTIQFFGHRNPEYKPIKINKSCYNLCDTVEMGGNLRCAVLSIDGVEEVLTKNTVCDLGLMELRAENHAKKLNKIVQNISVEKQIELYRKNPYIKESVFADCHISSFNFTKEAFHKDKWSTMTQKARGIFINTHINEIVARSYDKFFVLGQNNTVTLEAIAENYEDTIHMYIKPDGFLAILGYDSESDDFVFTSKSEIAPYGLYANHFKKLIEPTITDYNKLKHFTKKNKVSLVFEVCDTKFDPHIIEYANKRIILLDCIKNSFAFTRFSYKDRKQYDRMLASIVDSNFTQIDGISIECKEYVHSFETKDIYKNYYYGHNRYIEGYVCQDDAGNMFKLKTHYYNFHKKTRTIYDYLVKTKKKQATNSYNSKLKMLSFDELSHAIYIEYDKTEIYHFYEKAIEYLNSVSVNDVVDFNSFRRKITYV